MLAFSLRTSPIGLLFKPVYKEVEAVELGKGETDANTVRDIWKFVIALGWWGIGVPVFYQ